MAFNGQHLLVATMLQRQPPRGTLAQPQCVQLDYELIVREST